MEQRATYMICAGPGSAPGTTDRPRPEQDWGAVIERTANGDEAALAALYDGTAALVNGLALRIVRDPHVAEEVTMDVYLQVWRQAAHYDRSRGAPIAWLLTLARSRAIDRLRSAGAVQARLDDPLPPDLAVADDDPGPEANVAAAECRQAVASALAQLSPEQRRAVELAYFSGLSHSEIADALGEPLGTIKTRIRLAMTRLRESLTLGAVGLEIV